MGIELVMTKSSLDFWIHEPHCSGSFLLFDTSIMYSMNKNKTPSSVLVFPQRPEGDIVYIIDIYWVLVNIIIEHDTKSFKMK
jgi:hypothetical protein